VIHGSPVFFPDGRRIAYFRRDGAGCGIVERNLDDAVERELVGCAAAPGRRFDLAPDGRHLVYVSLREGEYGLRLLEIATGRVTPLTTPPQGAGADVYPRFSPDGRRVAFMRGPQGMHEAWTVPVDGPGQARASGSPRGMSWGLAWLGNDGPLLVSADWLGFRALDVLDLATGAVTLAGARGAQFPDVGPQGDIVYEAASYQANLQLLDTADPAAPPKVLWPSARYSNYPQFSPDGSRVVFLSNRDNAASLFVGVPGGEMRRLPLPADYIFVRAHWSHDGRALYAVRGRARNVDVPTRGVRIDPSSGRVETLDALGDGVTDVRDADGGRMLYFATQDGNVMQLWRAPADAPGRREKLPLPSVDEYDLRGARLAYSAPRGRDLVVCDLPDLRCAPAGLPDLEERSGWALADDALWVGIEGDPGELLRFDLQSRSVTLRLPHGPSAIGPNVGIAPDQRRAIIARQEPPAIDLMIARRPR
jgi:hypothetical protein